MRLLLIPLLLAPLVAQEPKPAAKPEEKAAEQKPAEKPAESPAPQVELRFSGNVDFGYRWRTDVRGNFNSYRSVVDLGEGPKLFGWDFTLLDPTKRFFDRLDTRGSSWGGDPYNTAHVDARKLGAYRLTADYRNIAYFNNLPSFADPQIAPAAGFFLNERSFDIHRRLTDVQLDLFPGKRIIPYLAYARDSGFGRGVAVFVGSSNEYPAATDLRDKTDNYRGGVRFEMKRYHLTLEQGGTTFKDDQRLSSSTRNIGNRTFLPPSQQLFLADLNQAYGIRGDSIYSKVLVTANPISWADIYGQFLYSRPQTSTNYTQANTGLFLLAGTQLFFNAQSDLLFAEAKQPHSSGNVGAELRPLRRLRIIESWMTDRLHNATFSLLTEQILTNPPTNVSLSFPDRFVLNYNQHQVDALVDITSKLTLRGGHRYVWGDAAVRTPRLSPVAGLDSRELRRQVALAGLSVRPAQRLSVNFDAEVAASDRTYFRTGLHDYLKIRARARYQFSPLLAISHSDSALINDNPSGYSYRFLDQTLSLFFTPGGGKRFSVLAEYTHSSLKSDVMFRIPQDLSASRSLYRDNAHTGSALADFVLPAYAGMAPRIAFGGSFFASSGSRPTRYYQPLARISVPLEKHVSWNSEWRWYGFGERFYLYEGFRAHLFVTGLRLTR